MTKKETANPLRAKMAADVAKAAPTSLNIKKIRVQMMILFDAKERATKLAADMEREAATIKLIEEQTLPTLFDEAGVGEITLDGHDIKVCTEIYPSVLKTDQQAFFKWLRAHKFGALIKNQVIASFGMGQDAKAVEVAALLVKKGVDVDQKQSVHPGTLKAWVNEQRDKAAVLPSMLNVNPIRRVTIK